MMCGEGNFNFFNAHDCFFLVLGFFFSVLTNNPSKSVSD